MRSRVWVVLVIIAALSVPGGCAYFNLFYNAQRAFDDAERIGREVDPRNQPTSQQRQQYQRAIRKCRTLLDEYPESGLVDNALFLMGKSHLRLKEYSDAIRNFDNVLANFPSSEFVEETMYFKSIAHLGRGDEQVGLEWFARLRESFPAGRFGPEALFRLGDTYADAGRSEQAINYYRDFLEQYPKRPERAQVQLSLARVQLEAGRSAEAIQTLEGFDAAQLSPEAAFEARRLLIDALVDEGRADEAESYLDALYQSATADGERDNAQLLRGRVLLSMGRDEEGIGVMQDLARLRSGQPIASEALGQVVDHAASVYGPGSAELEAAIAATADVRMGGEWAQRIRARNEQIERYQKLRAQVDAADSASAQAASELAEMALFDFDRPSDAVLWYEQVLHLGPDSSLAPRAAYAIGWIRSELLDDEEGAQAVFALLDERYPDSMQARARAGESFTTAKERTREQLEALMAVGGLGGGVGSGGMLDGSRGGDPRFAATRSLRFGGPGATSPREPSRR